MQGIFTRRLRKRIDANKQTHRQNIMRCQTWRGHRNRSSELDTHGIDSSHSLNMDIKRKHDTTSESDFVNSDTSDVSDLSGNSDTSDNEVEYENESDPWAPLKAEVSRRNIPKITELIEGFTADGLDEEEAKNRAYLDILPQLRKDLQNVYLERLLWIRKLKKDPIHKKIMETRDAFINDDNFDQVEALEAAIDKRKFLMKRLFKDTRSPVAHDDSE